MKIITLFLTLLVFCSISGIMLAQETMDVPEDGLNPPPTEVVSKDSVRTRTDLEHRLTYAVLLFGFLIISFEMLLIKWNKIDQQDAIKFVIVTLIVIGTLFLISAGWSNDQIAPAFGLLGTIAGYMLGKQTQHPSPPPETTKP